jgi:hypothetical protein
MNTIGTVVEFQKSLIADFEKLPAEYKTRDFQEAVRMLRFVFDNDTKSNICALQFTIRVYFENLQGELAENPKSRPPLKPTK